MYAGKLAAELAVSKDAILQQVNYSVEKKRKQQKDRQLSQIVRQTENTIRKVNPGAEKHLRAVSAEEGLLGLLLLNPDFIGPMAERLPPEHMVTDFNRRLYRQLIERHKNGLLVELAFLSADYSEDEMAYMSAWCGTRRREKLLLRKPGVTRISSARNIACAVWRILPTCRRIKSTKYWAAMRDLKK